MQYYTRPFVLPTFPGLAQVTTSKPSSKCLLLFIVQLLIILHHPLPVFSLDLVAESSHAALVLIDEEDAVLGGILRVGEEHALVALALFLLADAAGLLESVSVRFVRWSS
jgi:hypothetical protein